MSGLLKSSTVLTKDIAERMEREKERTISVLSLSGKTNLNFRINLQTICEEAKSVLEAYMEAYMEACRLNGESIAVLGDSFEEIDSKYSGKLKKK